MKEAKKILDAGERTGMSEELAELVLAPQLITMQVIWSPP